MSIELILLVLLIITFVQTLICKTLLIWFMRSGNEEDSPFPPRIIKSRRKGNEPIISQILSSAVVIRTPEEKFRLLRNT